ncbi:hypothetical protein GO988_11290 [Hymenobacter sp. HMF4947]|uniref:Uncharacterized protein n=1 Tax=Hymenobacter ginkgonis TaxID=2682976 RepID=A0A7K1TES6_9BACT|nr:hypothetical protein [Hymenobacter ginkgonis]MVN76908.1 hypothetical protein [Hymenobacter ginkgonis]
MTRVVLHRIDDSEDYTDLHSQMESRGFSRIIVGSDGRRYRLPPAEYVLVSDTLNRENVKKLAEAAVAEVMKDETTYIKKANKEPSIMVTSGDGVSWSGLVQVFASSKR